MPQAIPQVFSTRISEAQQMQKNIERTTNELERGNNKSRSTPTLTSDKKVEVARGRQKPVRHTQSPGEGLPVRPCKIQHVILARQRLTEHQSKKRDVNT